MKTDHELGLKVQQYLRTLKLDTPTIDERLNRPSEEKIEAIAAHFQSILEILGLDLSDDSLIDTPRRVAKMYVNEIFSGLLPENFPKCTTIENRMGAGPVVETNINMLSSCEHHLITIQGKKVAVGYIPSGKVIGLSKLNRIVKYFAQRPQVQERLTLQIAHAIAYVTGSQDVLVYIDAEHFCVKQRGVEDGTSSTKTCVGLGKLRDVNSPERQEMLRMIAQQ